MHKWDVIVVGAGQAGCAAAQDLAAAGKQALILDKPGTKPCAGGVTNKALRLLRFSLEPIVRERPKQLDMSLNGWRSLRWDLQTPMCVLVERHELDAFCLDKAISTGAGYQSIAKLEKVHQDHHRVVVSTDAGRFEAPFVIAADGAHSPMRRLLVGGERAAGAFAIEAKLPRGKASHYPGMQFDFQAAKKGYGWLFPKGDHINVGLYVSNRKGNLPGRDALKAYSTRMMGTDALEDIAGYPLGTRMPVLHSAAGRVLFAGDALGSCEKFLGEGIYGAILTGQMAAAAVLQEKAVAANYEADCAEWRREIRWLSRAAQAFYAMTPLAYGALHHGLRRALTQGYAAGLTPLQCLRLLRGVKLPDY